MSKLHAALAATAALICTAASAAPPSQEWRTTTVDLPDGSKADIRYVGDIPPRVTVTVPVVQEPRSGLTDEAIDDAPDADPIPRARRVVSARLAPAVPAPPAPPAAPPPQFIVAGDTPSGSTYHYTLITTGADGRVCTQRTEWTSRGKGKEPRVERRDTGDGCAGLTPPTPSREPSY